jgi:hypothetical protein
MKIGYFSLCVLLAATLAPTGCGKSSPGTESDDSLSGLSPDNKVPESVVRPDFTAAARTPEFQHAIREASELLGAEPKPLISEAAGEEEVIAGGVSFDVPRKKIEAILFKAHTNFLARGCYLFRCDQNFGMNGLPDVVGLLPTTDKFAVMAAMDINGNNCLIGTAGGIAWMKELEDEHPYLLTGIGFDYLEGVFTEPVKNADDLAGRMHEFCPNIVDPGSETVEALAAELRSGRLYLWWD